jgi:beta-phosphoglucomutase
MIAGRSVLAVVFDMDGVLIDSHPAHRAAWTELLRMSGRNASAEELSFILEGRTRSEILRHFFGDIAEEQLSVYGKLKDEIFRSMEHTIAAVPGVLNFVKELQEADVAMAVATSASEIRTFSTLERMGLGGCFEAVVTAGDVAIGKPDPAVYRLACQQVNASPEQTIAFDDAIAGVEAARSAGMRCIGVASNGVSTKLVSAGAERVISDFAGFGLNCL